MKPILHTIVIALLATVAFAPAQEAPAKKKKMAPLNQVSEARTGKIYSTKPENKRFTVRLDDNQWVVTPEKTNKVVAFQVAENSKITIDGVEGKVEGLQKGMKVKVIPQVMDPGKADKVEATKSAPDEKKAGETEE
jgi:membrane protein implicated in regulation of membrane protease activity